MKVMNVLAAGAALATLGATAAGAVEVRQVVEIKAAPAVVWGKIGGWCAIKDWHPAIANCDAGKRGFRVLILKDGGAKIVEKLTKTGKNSYSYEILESPLPVKNYQATLIAKPDSLGTTDLTWTAKFDPAKGKTEAEATAAINGVFEAGLKNIKDNVKMDASAAPAAATAAAPAAATDKEAARMKAREERRAKLEAAKLAAMEKYAQFKAAAAEKAKAAADSAKAAYEKAKAAVSDAMKKMEQPKK